MPVSDSDEAVGATGEGIGAVGATVEAIGVVGAIAGAAGGWSLAIGVGDGVVAGITGGIAKGAAGGVVVEVTLSLATPVGAVSRMDGFALLALATFFGGLFSFFASAACGPDSLGAGAGAARLIVSLSVVAIFAGSLALSATAAGGAATVSVLPIFEGATRGALPEVDEKWSSATAPPMTTATIVPKAMGK